MDSCDAHRKAGTAVVEEIFSIALCEMEVGEAMETLDSDLLNL